MQAPGFYIFKLTNYSDNYNAEICHGLVYASSYSEALARIAADYTENIEDIYIDALESSHTFGITPEAFYKFQKEGVI